MINRKNLLIILGLLIITSFIGYLTSFRYGIDFDGGIIININSNQPLKINYPHTSKTFGDFYIYELSIKLDNKLKEVSENRNELINCIRTVTNISECSIYLENIKNISEIPILNQSYNEYADMVLAIMINNTINEVIKNIEGDFEYSTNIVTPTLSKELFTRILTIFILGMIFTTIYIILTFKTWFPTINILSGALIDAFVTIGLISLLGFEIDLSVLVGLLVLFGYSLDTSVLLVSNYYYTRKLESIDESMKTGISMISSSMLVFIIILIIGSILNISFLKNISLVMIIGLIVDFFTSWGYNAYLIQKFGERYV